MTIVSPKYVTLILRADNHGEGGIMALLALVTHAVETRPKLRYYLMTAGVYSGGTGIVSSRWYGIKLARHFIFRQSGNDRADARTPDANPGIALAEVLVYAKSVPGRLHHVSSSIPAIACR
jgi:K+ potassium transporter